MLPLIASFVMLQASDEPPRLRTVLENDAVILVERMQAPVISVQLFASSKYVPETEGTHGYRHLLEHLLARGDGSLDRKLETQACFMTANTLRDAMQIEVTVGPSQLPVAMDTLATLLKPQGVTQERIDRELRVMRDELAMVDAPVKLASSAWQAAYGEGGLDPLGTFDSMYRATPEKLEEVDKRQFAADGIALVIAGPVDLDKATGQAKELLARLAKGNTAPRYVERKAKPGRVDADAFGECRAAAVPGFNTPQAMATLAAGLAIASELPSAFVIYTPTAQPGLVAIGRTDANSGVGLFIDSLADPGWLYSRGRALAKQWVLRQLQSPAGVAYLRGLLLSQGHAYRPETMLEILDTVTPRQFDAGVRAFGKDQAVIAVGGR